MTWNWTRCSTSVCDSRQTKCQRNVSAAWQLRISYQLVNCPQKLCKRYSKNVRMFNCISVVSQSKECQSWFRIWRRRADVLDRGSHRQSTICRSCADVRSRVQKFPAWHTEAAPNGKMLREIYSAIYGEVNVSVEKCVEMKGDCVEK